MPVTFTPTTLDFGTRPTGQPRVLELVVETSGATTFNITDASNNLSLVPFAVSPTSVPNAGKFTLKVTFTGPAVGAYSRTLNAFVSGALAPATAALSGTCANLTIEQSPVDFSEQPVGSSTIRSVLISNYGGTTVTLSTTGAAFTIVDAAGNPSTDLTLATGQAKLILIRFKPSSTGTFTGTVVATPASGTAVSANLTGEANDVTLLAGEVGGDVSLVPTRLHIEVPTTETSLTMGRAINNLSYDGCGLTTHGDIFLNAIGASSHLWAQSRADMVLQSFENNIYMLAKSGWTTAAVGGASLLGGGGVTIASGFKKDPVVATADAAQPPDTGAADNLAKSVAGAAVAAGVIDAGLAFGLGIRTLYGVGSALYKAKQAGRLGDTLANKWGVTAMAILGGIGGLAAGVVGSWGTHATNTGGSSPFAGVSIFGAGGVVVGTPAFCSIYGAAGVVIGSMFPVVWGFDCEMMGMRSATISGYRNAVIQSHSKTTVHSDGDVEISADGGGGGGIPFMKHIPGLRRINRGLKVGKTKEGMVNIRGNRVHIGKSDVAFDDAAAGTDVVLGAGTIGAFSGASTAFMMDHDIAAYLLAAQKVMIKSGQFVASIRADGIALGRALNPAPDTDADAAQGPRFLLAQDGAFLEAGESTFMVENNRAYMGSGETWVECTNGETTIDGQRVMLG